MEDQQTAQKALERMQRAVRNNQYINGASPVREAPENVKVAHTLERIGLNNNRDYLDERFTPLKPQELREFSNSPLSARRPLNSSSLRNNS